MKRLVSLLLLAALLCSVVAYAGCGDNTGDGPVGPVEQIIDYGVGEHNFGGESVKISCFSLFDYEIYAEEDSTEFIDDAIFKRNRRVEAAFNVVVEPVVSVATGGQDLDTHYKDVLGWMNSGDPVFDTMAMYAYQAGKLVLRGELFDLRSDLVPYISTSIKNGADWWPTQINIDSTINGAQFLGVSDLCLTAMEMCYAVAFNKDIEETDNIAEAFGHENLYQMVDNNKWTLDIFHSIVKDRWDNAPSSSDDRDENDTYGLVVGGGTDADAWAYALGFKYVKNDGDTTPELWDWNSGIVTAIEDLRELYTATGTWKQWGDDYAKRTDFFANGHALFNLTTLLELKTDVIHNMESEFGILPYPKLSTSQKIYKTGTMDHWTMLGIPTAIGINEPLTRTCVVVEALSVDSNKTVRDQYYNLIVTHKNTTDEDSVRMIELIMAGRTYDLSTYHYEELKLVTPTGGSTGNSSYGLFFRYTIADTGDIAAYWTSNVDQLNRQFNQLIADYNEMASWM